MSNPPPNPFYTREYSTTVAGGVARCVIPAPGGSVSVEDANELTEWMALIQRRLTRDIADSPVSGDLDSPPLRVADRDGVVLPETQAEPAPSENSAAMDHCFVCGVQFDASVVDGPRDWPGTIFIATGNWGSTIYDPSPSARPAQLHIRICDSCVLARRSRIVETGDHLPGDDWKQAIGCAPALNDNMTPEEAVRRVRGG